MPLKGFDYGKCRCSGRFEDRFVEVRLNIKGKIIVLTDVPQGVCSSCGTKVYRTGVLGRIEELMRSGIRQPPEVPPQPGPQKGPMKQMPKRVP